MQYKIFFMDNNQRDYDKGSEQMLNEHKYLNTLANVHQVRFNLKETQDRYNKMASELQAKLVEKQQKCHEIEAQFKALKNSVSKSAQFVRTGKALQPSAIAKWEEHEALKDQEVYQYRLQNISLRNRYDNLQKQYQKKEQLADGLHMIDFEQLKIENNTLNEKIEERNEELSRLKKKITYTVINLSHTREKYQWFLKKNEQKKKEVDELTEELKNIKMEHTKLKGEKEKEQKHLQKMKQLTGIVSQKSLKKDYKARAVAILELKELNESLKAKHEFLNERIKEARQLQATDYQT